MSDPVTMLVGQLDPMGLISSISPTWGWLLLFVWVTYQLYWPFWTTKIQTWHDDMSARFHRIEIGQINLAELDDEADEDEYRELHDKRSLTTRDLKDVNDGSPRAVDAERDSR